MSSVADSFVDTASKKVSSSLPSGGVNCSPRLLVLDNLLGQADEFGDDFSGRELLIGVPIHQLGDPLGELLGAQLVVSCGGAGFLLELPTQAVDEQRDISGGLVCTLWPISCW